QLHALLWGTSLTPAQEAMGDKSAAWPSQRNYVGLWKLEPATATRPRRWRPLWERITGGDADDEDEPQRVLYVDVRDVTGDGTPAVEVIACRHGKEVSASALARARRDGEEEDEGPRLQDGRPRPALREVRRVRRGNLVPAGRAGAGRPRHLRLHALRARAQLEGER